jgi:hypothetical protein
MFHCRHPASSKRDVRVVTIRGVRAAMDVSVLQRAMSERTNNTETYGEVVWS